MARVMDGVITIVQEGRFQLQDDAGVWHLFILGPGAAAETGQLQPLERQGARVRVRYTAAPDIIGHQATEIIRVGG